MNKFTTEVELIIASGLFDTEWYLAQHADVRMTALDPILHYLTVGAELGRDPSLDFNTGFYLRTNPDVVAAGINPLVHYISCGKGERRAPVPVPPVKDSFTERVDIVVPVYNALEDVQRCLRSIECRQDGFLVQVFVVNDGSNEVTSAWLREFCAVRTMFTLIEHDGNKGYTKAVNTGLRATTAPYAITLNSDTIVTHGWLKGMVRCVNSHSRLGIVGPLSNAASWQNVPDLFDKDGTFAINVLPDSVTPDEMARLIARISTRAYPQIPFVNGFCFLIKRAVIEAIGFMDELNFPVGYGEENDFCIRAADAGFLLAIVDDVYVFHAKSKSFGHSQRKELSQQGSASLKRKHSGEKFDRLVKEAKNITALASLRLALKAALDASGAPKVSPIDFAAMKILFLLPVRGGGGGSHSVVQEVAAMRGMGVVATVAVKVQDKQRFVEMYADIPNAHELFVGFGPENLIDLAFSYDIAIGTIFSSMSIIKKMVEVNPRLLPAYYVQDYEPLFFAKESAHWQAAHASYTLVPGAALFAKTDWIINQVRVNHGVEVHKVEPSIDHSVYRLQARTHTGVLTIAAMIRPQTAHRGAERTMRLLARIHRVYGSKISFHIFGCESDNPLFQHLERNFPFVNHGVLKRPQVTALLGQSDIFVDLSDYQAFGRTALEAMACGCTAMVPVHGGTDEYAIDGVNAIVVDTFDEDECFQRLNGLLSAPGQITTMKHAGMLTAARYSVGGAALSELVLFSNALARHTAGVSGNARQRMVLVPSMTQRNKEGFRHPTGSAYVRLLVPYLNTQIRRRWQVQIAENGVLPVPGTAEVAVLQRDVNIATIDVLDTWANQWRAAGGRIFLEIDDDLFDAKTLSGRTGVAQIEQMTKKVQWLAKASDRVIVSTQRLAEIVAPYNAEITVVPNYLDVELWGLDRPRDHAAGNYARLAGGPIMIGYIGTPSHVEDVGLIEHAMQRLQSEYGSAISVEVIGVFQNVAPTFGTRVGLPKKSDYRNFVHWLHQRVHWDIGVIPLIDNKFNRSKSNLKFLEYAALDMAIICSDVETYRNVARDGVNALVVENAGDAWYRAIKKLIDDEALRRRLARAARSEVIKDYTIDGNADTYFAALAGQQEIEQRMPSETF